MEILWKSDDGYVVVVDGVAFPDEDAQPSEISDLHELAQAGAWIVVWRSEGKDWRFWRNRRYGKPSLQALRHQAREHGLGIGQWDNVYINPSDCAGRIYPEYFEASYVCGAGTVEDFAAALYAAWGYEAARHIQAKAEFLKLDINEPPAERLNAWLRPGLRRYAEHRRELRELLEEIEEVV